jgi:glycerophosphoryl diester phosphodiesterase
MKQFVSVQLLAAALLLFSGCTDTSPKVDPIAPEAIDIQGHRGSRGHLPENSIPGFILALEQGATTLEMDLVVSADSQLVVNHEPWLNEDICKSPDGEPVRDAKQWNFFELPMEVIRQCDCGSRPHPRFTEQRQMAVNRPALWEVISVTEKLYTRRDSVHPDYNIEIKFRDEGAGIYHPEAAPFARLVIDEVMALGVTERTTIQSFSAKALDAVHALAPDISTAWLTEDAAPVKEQVERLSFVPTIYSPDHSTLTPERIAEARSMGMKVIPWTVNDTERMKELINMGVNGIITDYPDRLWTLLKEMSETNAAKANR